MGSHAVVAPPPADCRGLMPRQSPGTSPSQTLWQSHAHLPKTSCVSGAAAEDASLRKIAKYTGVRQRYDFVAIAVETLGPMNEDGVNFLLEIGRRLSSISGDPRETSFLLQRVSVTLQRYTTPSPFEAVSRNWGVLNRWLRSRGVWFIGL